jgi:uncharacterized protein (DUF302 family)
VDVVTKHSPRPVTETVERFRALLDAKGLKVFAVVDQSLEAARVGLSLRETTLVVFGSSAAGTPVMVAAPLAALDLPLKIVVWSDDESQTNVSYVSPAALAARYGLSSALATNLAGIDALTDALVVPPEDGAGTAG